MCALIIIFLIIKKQGIEYDNPILQYWMDEKI